MVRLCCALQAVPGLLIYQYDRKALKACKRGGLCFNGNKLVVPWNINCNEPRMDTKKLSRRILLPLFQQEMMISSQEWGAVSG